MFNVAASSGIRILMTMFAAPVSRRAHETSDILPHQLAQDGELGPSVR